MSDLAGIWTHQRFYGCPVYLQVWWFFQKWTIYPLNNIFSIISLLENFSSLKGSNSEANSPNRSEIKLEIKDFMTVFATCKLDEDPIKNEVAIFGTTFSPL